MGFQCANVDPESMGFAKMDETKTLPLLTHLLLETTKSCLASCALIKEGIFVYEKPRTIPHETRFTLESIPPRIFHVRFEL